MKAEVKLKLLTDNCLRHLPSDPNDTSWWEKVIDAHKDITKQEPTLSDRCVESLLAIERICYGRGI